MALMLFHHEDLDIVIDVCVATDIIQTCRHPFLSIETPCYASEFSFRITTESVHFIDLPASPFITSA
jgi:hypothetical protein